MLKLTPLPQRPVRKSLGDQVYETIRAGIVSLQLEPGTMIYENEVAELLQVSRTPVREAIRLLVSERLLDVLPQRGTRIAPISQRKVEEAKFIREHLELGAFRLVARQWRDGDRTAAERAIVDLFDRQQEAAAAGDPALFLQLDEDFHRVVLEMTGNATLLQVINQMRAHLNRIRFLAMREYHYMEQTLEEHRGLLAAMQAGDEELTASRLKRHIGKLDRELPELRAKYPQYFVD